MLDGTEGALLRAIADAHADNLPRLVYADWIEERGDATRAEFIRVQCEWDSSAEPEAHSLAVLLRERELMTAHRREWCDGLGVPVEDVQFERGLIAAVRLTRWGGGRLLASDIALRFATLTELDLSGLQLQDDDLAAFADAVQFPRLRRLLLSDNTLSDAGANRLARATGLPKLETVYLFGNSITATGRAVLTGSSGFRLATLDVGERANGYCLSRGEAEMARRRYVRENLLPFVRGYFDKYERLQSAMLCIGQYWCDEANDAVHGILIVSERPEPILEGVRADSDTGDDLNVPHTRIVGEYGETGSTVSIYRAGWDSNSGAIPLWAGFAPEGGHQEYEYLSEVYLPAVMFYRHGGYEFLPMTRPQLDGVRPEWGEYE